MLHSRTYDFIVFLYNPTHVTTRNSMDTNKQPLNYKLAPQIISSISPKPTYLWKSDIIIICSYRCLSGKKFNQHTASTPALQRSSMFPDTRYIDTKPWLTNNGRTFEMLHYSPNYILKYSLFINPCYELVHDIVITS